MGSGPSKVGKSSKNAFLPPTPLPGRTLAYMVHHPSALAGDGLYREPRHFTAWVKEREIEAYKLHAVVRRVTGQKTVPIGDFILETVDTSVTCETCEELVSRRCQLFASRHHVYHLQLYFDGGRNCADELARLFRETRPYLPAVSRIRFSRWQPGADANICSQRSRNHFGRSGVDHTGISP